MTRTPRGSNNARNCSSLGRGHRTFARCVVQLDQCVHGDRDSVGTNDQRVHVDAGHVRPLVGQATEAHEHVDQPLTIDGRLPAEFTQQLLGGEVRDHLGRRHAVERGGSKHHVGDRLGQDATHSQHHAGPELGVTHDTGDEFAIPLHHGRHQHGDRTILRASRRQQLGGRVTHGFG